MKFEEVWLGFLCDTVIRECVDIAKNNCAGCKANLSSPLLHEHEQASLFNKLEQHFEEARAKAIKVIPQLCERLSYHGNAGNPKINDQGHHIYNGRQFLTFANPSTIYYGRYIDNNIDERIKQHFDVPKTPVVKKRKKSEKKDLLENVINEAFNY